MDNALKKQVERDFDNRGMYNELRSRSGLEGGSGGE